jgi:TatA/E family protein of Tat protein translocase
VCVPFNGALSPLHWLIVAVVAVVVLGPEQVPRPARTVGSALREFRRIEARLGAGVQDFLGDGNASAPDGDHDKAPSRGERVWPPGSDGG